MLPRDESPDPSWHIPVPEDGEPRELFLDRLRPALTAIAQDLVDRDLQAKIGVSDLVQETMLEVVRDMDNVRSKDPRQFERWCREVLLNNFRDVTRFFRRTRRRPADHQELPLTADMPDPRSNLKPDLPLLKEEQLLQMNEAIGRLPAPHQQMLKWRYMDRYSYRKIANLVARKEDAVRMMVNRSLDRLKREMSRLNDSSA
ncbi:MAG: sigma-70 family RNA polymerase sigma factor [Pirellula sp.]|jgi:RNA polymerase sigma factor (sigma-70 family)|nr:sigma-70 family RNA polymerase sigma factor [Pirellula sp.]